MISSEVHTLGSWADSLISFLEAQGCSKEQIFVSTGLDIVFSNHHQRRYPLSDLSRLWRYAYEQYGVGIGLQVARYFRPSHWSSVGLALQSCRNLDEFICRICRYIPLISNAIELVYEPSEIAEKKLITRFVVPVELAHERVESYIASALELLKLMYGYMPELARADLPRSQPADPSAWYATFGSRIVWDAPELSLHISRSVLETKAPHIDGRLSLLHETDLSQRLEQLDQQSFSQRIRQEILKMLPNGELSIKEVADVLYMSTRSLQRHLEEDGVGFRQLVEAARLHMAQHYLVISRYSLYEIALLTGFSNQSNFSNAFKRWTGMTPTQYREQQKPD